MLKTAFRAWFVLLVGGLLLPVSCGQDLGSGPPSSGGRAGAGGSSGCVPGQASCTGACVDISSNAFNCGACGRTCANGQSCNAGVCGCQGGLTACGSLCTSLTTDAANCGACGTACALGQSCVGGACTCPAGATNCSNSCVDTTTNNTNCGACGTTCTTGQSCTGGSCQCLAGLTACGTSCVSIQSDAANCGACGNVCPAGQVCSNGACGTTCGAGLTQCGQSCVDSNTDESNCGTCGTACPGGSECVAGGCSCVNGQTRCGDVCLDTRSDPANCGACGATCATGQTCSGGQCSCPSGQGLCDGQCVVTQTSNDHCGACDNACSGGRSCSGGQCVCPGSQTFCGSSCTDTMTDEANCGSCGTTCSGGATCTSGTCSGGSGGAGGSGGTGGGGTGGGGTGGTGGGGTGGTGGGGTGGTGGGGGGTCEPGSTTTQWATSCPTSAPACTSGTWSAWGSSSPENYPFRYETQHFAFYWPDGRNVTLAQAQSAGQFLEDVVWRTLFGSPMYFPELDCNTANKRKTSIHIIESGLFGGCNNGRPGIWVGPGAMADHWGLAHEFTHALQCMTAGVPDCGAGGCWMHESHANWHAHQLQEYRGDVHCSEMLVNAPHVYYGSTRDRYCNWQFFEFVKNKHCYKAINDIWTATNVPNGQRDPLGKLMYTMGWDAEALNDVFGEWAMHNITWDYKDPPPTSGTNQGSTYRSRYGAITDTSRPERRHRLTRLESLDGQWASNRRFVSPFYQAPQRGGYNVIRLYPEAGATSVTVTFRGVTQSGANSGWRWGLVATDANLTTPRYSPLQRGADGELNFCINSGESLWLVVVGTPNPVTKIIWDQAYPSIYRYPYMVQLAGAWPEGFRNGQLDACPSGTQRHSNGGGCAPSSLSSSIYVGPYAQVLGGSLSGSPRIEDHAVILNGATVSGGTVGALSVMNRFNVSGTARVQTTFYPVGFFESGQGLSGSARLFGDVEYRGQGLNRNSGSFYGFVDVATQSQTINDVTTPPPYTWR